MDFTSSFFEQEPEFMVESTTGEEGTGEGGGWVTAAWWNDSFVGDTKDTTTNTGSSSGSNRSNSRNDNDNVMFDPFVLSKDNMKQQRTAKTQYSNNNKNNKISFYSVSIAGVGGSSSSKNISSRTCNPSSSNSHDDGTAGRGGRPLGAPWRVDLDDSELLNNESNSISISISISTTNTGPTTKQQESSHHCLVDLDDTILLGQDDDDDDDDDDDEEANHHGKEDNENAIFNNSNDPTEKHHSSSATSSPTTRTTTTSDVSPIDPWRFDVDRSDDDHCFTSSAGPVVGLDQLLDGNNSNNNSRDDVYYAGKSLSSATADNVSHHHGSLDPWIEIVSINDDSTINGGTIAPVSSTTSPFRASHNSNQHHHHHHHHHPQQQQHRPEALPEFDNNDDDDEEEDEGRDDSSGNKNNSAVFQKNMMNHDDATNGTGGDSCCTGPITAPNVPLLTTTTTSPASTIARNMAAACVVTPTSASTSSTSTTTLQQQQQQQEQQQGPINEDSFGFAPFHTLGGEAGGINVTERDNADRDSIDAFGEASVFGLYDDHPTKNHHHHKGDSYCSPPDNVDPYNSLAIIEDDESTTAEGYEESTAAHAVDHFHQDDDDDDSGNHPPQEDTTPPSFITRRSFNVDNKKITPFEEHKQHDENNDDDDCDDVDEKILVVEVQMSDDEGAFEVTATSSGKAFAVAQDEEEEAATVADTDAADTTTAADFSASVVDDPTLQVVESVDDDATYLQDQDVFNDDRIYCHNRSEISSADHGSGSGPASTSYSSNSMNSSGTSCSLNSMPSSMEQSKHWITIIVAHELWSDDSKVVEMAMGTLHRILLRSILPVSQTNNNDNSHSRITESMSSHSVSASSHKGGKANASSNRANANKYELIELAFCRGCPLAVIRAMKAHPTNAFLQDSGLCILNVFCWNGVATHVVEVGSLERAMAAIEQSKHMDIDDEEKATATRRNTISCILKNSASRNTIKGAPEVVESAIYHIANLLRDKNLAARVIEARGLELIVGAMTHLSTQADVQLAGCCAFRNLLQHHPRIIIGRQWANKVVKVGAIDRVIAALDDHPGNEKLQLEGCKILRRLSKLNDDCQDYRQDVDSHDDCHKEEHVSQCFFRTKDNVEVPDFFAPSFEI